MTQEELQEHWLVVLTSLAGESERGAVLVGAAYVDQQLQALLLSFFVEEAIDTSKDLERLLDNSGPLSSTSGKEAIAYACGLISAEELKRAAAIRKIRNQYGHNILEAQFSHKDLDASVKTLHSYAQQFFQENDPHEDLGAFILTASSLGATLSLRSKAVSRAVQQWEETEEGIGGSVRQWVEQKKVELGPDPQFSDLAALLRKELAASK